jgi:hypothetical protein
MTLPKKAEKEYLQVQRFEGRPSIVGQREHVAELAALFEQHGIGCRRASATPAAEEVLLFDPGADVVAIEEILQSYQSARGS